MTPNPIDEISPGGPRGVRIALDAFGGDSCPGPELQGAIEAAAGGVQVVLVGDRAILEPALARAPGSAGLPITIHHASETIGMADAPSKAVRSKPDASMPVCFDLVRRGEADAVMSAGNSGAMLACGLFKYRRITGVDRPALVTSLPTMKDFVTFLDIGAVVEPRAIHLAQFAVLGSVYARFKHGSARPRVGLLSNGTEASKGNEMTRAVDRLLHEYPSDDYAYVGYVEGGDVFSGDLDVVVTDGFTGNVTLKMIEATGRLTGRWLRRTIESAGWRTRLGGWLLRPTFRQWRAMVDPDTYGAAPLLGVNGVAFICHGSSSPTAISTALRLAARSVTEELMPKLADAVARHRALFDAVKATEGDERGSRVSHA